LPKKRDWMFSNLLGLRITNNSWHAKDYQHDK
jgi:hypothetical protein